MATPAYVTMLLKDAVGIPVQQRPSAPPATGLSKRAPRRRLTGRNQQLNIKVTAAVADQFYDMADELDVPLGELIRRALAALAVEGK